MSNLAPTPPRPTPDERVRLQVHVPASLAAELAALANEADRPLSRELRRALAGHVEREREQSS